MRLVGSGLRTAVVTLDPKRNESETDAPAVMLRSLGHDVEVIGYDLAELRGPIDVALVEAGEHLEIGRHAIKRLRQRDRKSTRLNSSHLVISYAVFCLKKKKKKILAFTLIKKKKKYNLY